VLGELGRMFAERIPTGTTVLAGAELGGEGGRVDLADENVYVVATLPSADRGGLRVPANARVEQFLPHGPVLDRAACAVTHGGMGATQKALARGVPVCAVPVIVIGLSWPWSAVPKGTLRSR
jgi:hypothetical protein